MEMKKKKKRSSRKYKYICRRVNDVNCSTIGFDDVVFRMYLLSEWIHTYRSLKYIGMCHTNIYAFTCVNAKSNIYFSYHHYHQKAFLFYFYRNEIVYVRFAGLIFEILHEKFTRNTTPCRQNCIWLVFSKKPKFTDTYHDLFCYSKNRFRMSSYRIIPMQVQASLIGRSA